LVGMVGWAQFFFFSFLIALPGVWLVWVLRRRLQRDLETDLCVPVQGADL